MIVVMAEARKPKRGSARKPTEKPVVVFEYIKSPSFRVIHADGAIGGITPQGNIHFALYSERSAIPQAIVHHRNEDGTLGDEVADRRMARPGIIREMDVDVVVSPDAAEALLAWLSQHVAQVRRLQKQKK